MKHIFYIIPLLCMVQLGVAQSNQVFYFKTQKLIETLDFIGEPIAEKDKIAIRQSIEKKE